MILFAALAGYVFGLFMGIGLIYFLKYRHVVIEEYYPEVGEDEEIRKQRYEI